MTGTRGLIGYASAPLPYTLTKPNHSLQRTGTKHSCRTKLGDANATRVRIVRRILSPKCDHRDMTSTLEPVDLVKPTPDRSAFTIRCPEEAHRYPLNGWTNNEAEALSWARDHLAEFHQ